MLRKALCIAVLFVVIGVWTAVGIAGDTPFKILLVGYGWYRGIPEGQTNNAEIIALALDNAMVEASENGHVVAQGKVHSIVIPVTWYGAWPPVEAAINELHPDIVVGLGTSPGAPGIRPEPYGSNVMNGCDANPEDPSQEVCKDKEPIQLEGPDWREGNLPYTEMVLAMLEDGIPAYRGKKTGYVKEKGEKYPTATPGWYLCNFLTYKLAWFLEEHPELDITAGFIHIPTRPEYVAWDRYDYLTLFPPGSDSFNSGIERSPSASMEMDRMIEGIRVSLEECVRTRGER